MPFCSSATQQPDELLLALAGSWREWEAMSGRTKIAMCTWVQGCGLSKSSPLELTPMDSIIV